MGRIIRGYWDCESCDTKGIDGLKDTCPNCGAGKPKNIKYYMKSADDVITEEELNKAGISKEECDGKHKEWVCSYCGNMNNYADITCRYCGASKDEKDGEYGDLYKKEQIKATQQHLKEKEYDTNVKNKKFSKKQIGVLSLIFAIIFILGFGLFPIKEQWVVDGFEWNRCITVEEQRTVNESGWTLPSEARLSYTRREIKTYEQVLDHYEIVLVTKSRQVFDHNETSTSYSDNGNGTFTEHTHSTPVYRTEYYTEQESKPVYRNEPVYATKYYYEIDRWFDLNDYKSSGKDHTPYWNTDYRLQELQRDTKRSEKYYILYENGEKTKESYNIWRNVKIRDKRTITKCRFGIVYKTESLNEVINSGIE